MSENGKPDFDFIGFWDDIKFSYYVILDKTSGKVVVSRVNNQSDNGNFMPERIEVSLLLYLKIRHHSCI